MIEDAYLAEAVYIRAGAIAITPKDPDAAQTSNRPAVLVLIKPPQTAANASLNTPARRAAQAS